MSESTNHAEIASFAVDNLKQILSNTLHKKVLLLFTIAILILNILYFVSHFFSTSKSPFS